MKKFTLLALSLMALALVLFNTGCTTATSTATTTTSSSVTTTTAAPVADTISGTITLSGQAGCLWVGATTDETFASGDYPGEITHEVVTGVTTYNYSLPMSGAGSGTYYVVAVLAVGRASFSGGPATGDKAGEYADGKMPASLGKTPTGTPTAIVYNAGDTITGKDFDLKVTW